MTVTGAQVRDTAVSHDGKYRYDTRDQTRCTGTEGFIDCSGSVVLTLNQLGIYGVPTVSATQARWCRDNGVDGVPLSTALATPGCLVFHGPNHGYDGFGNDGHVAITVGDGVNVCEARGHAYPASWIYSGLNRGWSNAGYVPGVDYQAHPVKVPKPPKLPRVQHFIAAPRTMHGDDILDTQTKLMAWAFITKNVGMRPTVHGVYDRQTAHAVKQFQLSAGLTADAIVGVSTWNSLFRI